MFLVQWFSALRLNIPWTYYGPIIKRKNLFCFHKQRDLLLPKNTKKKKKRRLKYKISSWIIKNKFQQKNLANEQKTKAF